MACPRCSTQNPEAACFCHRCGEHLLAGGDRQAHYAAHPGEPVRALALVSTLMPHISGSRHAGYRLAIGIALAASLVFAGFGVLSVSLVCAAAALPVLFLLYQYDHDVWDGEPANVVALTVVVAGALGAGVGVLQKVVSPKVLLHGTVAPAELLVPALAVPVVAVVAMQIVPALLTARPKFRHVLDAVNFSVAVGAAFSLAQTLVLQSGAFDRSVATNPSSDMLMAVTLGFAQPIVYGAATALVAVQVRRHRAGRVVPAAVAALVLVVALGATEVFLASYAARGVALTFVVAAVLAALAVVALRMSVHSALVDEAFAAVEAGETHQHASADGGVCGHCELPLLEGSAFCLACGSAVAAAPKQLRRHNVSVAKEAVA